MNRFELSEGTVSKAEIIDSVFEKTRLSKKDARRVVEAFFESLGQMLESGQVVKLKGFGVFDILEKKARPGRNLSTGQSVLIKERRVVNFRVSGSLRQYVQNHLDLRRQQLLMMQHKKKP